MSKNFKDAFKSFMSDRAFETSHKILINNHEYEKLTKQCITLHNVIKNHLTEDFKHLIDDYEKTENLINGIILELMYEQGFKDGIEFSNYLLLMKCSYKDLTYQTQQI